MLIISLQVQFFAHLTVARVISPSSMYELLKSFTAVFNELGTPSHTRASGAGLCAAEGLVIVSEDVHVVISRLTRCKAGAVIKDDPSLDISDIVNDLRTYIETTHEAKTLVQPITQLHSTKPTLEHAEEVNVHHALYSQSLTLSTVARLRIGCIANSPHQRLRTNG